VPMSARDPSHILRSVFDEVTESIKAKIDATISGVQEVIISHLDDSIQAVGFRGSLTDRSGSATTTSSVLAAANSSRKALFVQNLSTTTAIYINFGSAASAGSGSIKIPAEGSFSMTENWIDTQAVSVISASGTVSYTAKEG